MKHSGTKVFSIVREWNPPLESGGTHGMTGNGVGGPVLNGCQFSYHTPRENLYANVTLLEFRSCVLKIGLTVEALQELKKLVNIPPELVLKKTCVACLWKMKRLSYLGHLL